MCYSQRYNWMKQFCARRSRSSWCSSTLLPSLRSPTVSVNRHKQTLVWISLCLGPWPIVGMMLQSFTWKESAVAKSVRERNFPISFLLRGLHVRLEDGEATVTEAGHKAAVAGPGCRNSAPFQAWGLCRGMVCWGCVTMSSTCMLSSALGLSWIMIIGSKMLNDPPPKTATVCSKNQRDIRAISLLRNVVPWPLSGLYYVKVFPRPIFWEGTRNLHRYT